MVTSPIISMLSICYVECGVNFQTSRPYTPTCPPSPERNSSEEVRIYLGRRNIMALKRVTLGKFR